MSKLDPAFRVSFVGSVLLLMTASHVCEAAGSATDDSWPEVDRALAVASARANLGQATSPAPASLERLVELDPQNGEHWKSLASAHAAEGKLERALEEYKKAMELGAISRAEGECQTARWLAESDAPRARKALSRCLDSGTRDVDRLSRAPEIVAILSDDSDLRRRFGQLDADACKSSHGWLEDLDYLLGEVERLHWTYSRIPLPPATMALIEDFRLQTTSSGESATPLEEARSIVALQRILASLGDGHTVLYPVGQQRGTLGYLPLGFWWFDDGIYVLETRDQQYEQLVGRRVVELGGVETQEVLERIEPWVSHDNPSGYRWVAPVYLVFTDFLEAVGAGEPHIVTENAAGERVRHGFVPRRKPVDPSTLTLSQPAPPAVETPLALSRLDEVAWMKDLDEGTVFAKLDTIENELAQWAVELREHLTSSRAEHLILDLRRNRGGDAGNIPELVRTLVGFELGGGRIFVLTGRNTFSAAQTLLNELEWLTSATLVGEPPGTRPNRPGNETMIRLPCSGAFASIATGWNQNHTSRDHRVWMAPDVPVFESAGDFFAGHDATLEVALRLSAKKLE